MKVSERSFLHVRIHVRVHVCLHVGNLACIHVRVHVVNEHRTLSGDPVLISSRGS